MEVIHLDAAAFDKLTTQQEHPVLVDFWATWCGPCRMLGPVLEEIAAENPDLIIGKVNVDNERDLAIHMGIDSIPALFFYRNGKLEQRLVGYMDKISLLAKLKL